MNEKTVQNWLDLSAYDFETAKSMLKAGRYLYVAFVCHQTIEKILKAFYIKEYSKTPPYTHNLLKLIESLSVSSQLNEETKTFIEDLNSYYIQSRYSEDIAKITKSLTKSNCKKLYNETRTFYSWLKKQI